MQEEVSEILIQKSASAISYTTAGTLVLGDILEFLNHNASAIGVMLGAVTLSINFFYLRKRDKRESSKKG
jgi:hypothetical protein